MREIKFRAWDKHTKKIYRDVTYVKEDEDSVRPWIYMQYTGLKDSNSKEIYERDIILIKWKDKGGNPQKKRSVVEWNDAYAGYGNIFRHSDYEIYIIGNIYENPTLLEEGK